VGAALRTPLLAAEPEGQIDPAIIEAMPDAIHVPFQAAVGASYQWGPRPYNTPTGSTKAAPKTPTSRRFLLVAADLVLTGSTPEGLNSMAYLLGRREAAGRRPSLSLRAGAESEVLPNRLILRGGSYYEPCRIAGCSGRWHATGGGDLRVDAYFSWRFGLAFDVAQNYQNAGLSVGFWH
jgi:hypothetical protein